MKLLRLGQSLCEGKAAPPPPPTANALLYLKENTHMASSFDTNCVVISPETSSDASTINYQDKITRWINYPALSNQAEQSTCTDSPEYYYGAANFPTGESVYFDLFHDIVLTGEFSIYFKVTMGGTTNNAFIGGSTSNFWRISNNKEFRVRIGGTANNLFTETTDIIATNTAAPYVFCLQRDTSGFLSLFVDGGTEPNNYFDKAWGSTTNVDTDTMTITNIGATADDTQTFEGKMYDVLVYDTKHSTAQRNIIYDYL